MITLSPGDNISSRWQHFIPNDNISSQTNLRGHGNEADFLRFLHISVRHRFLTLHFEPFRFWLWICGDIRNRKTMRFHLGWNVVIWDEMLSCGMKCYHLELMLSSGTKCYEMLSSGANVIIWDEMLSSGMKCYHLELKLSSGMKCYHLGLNVIIWR